MDVFSTIMFWSVCRLGEQSAETPQTIWKLKYCLMEIKLPLVANIWILDCLQYHI